MTDKERLEEIKNTRHCLFSKEIDWLIEQAERVNELEICVGYLQGNIENLENNIKTLRSTKKLVDINHKMDLQSKDTKTKQLRAALEFYADDSNYSQDPENPILNDSGKLASKVLEELK